MTWRCSTSIKTTGNQSFGFLLVIGGWANGLPTITFPLRNRAGILQPDAEFPDSPFAQAMRYALRASRTAKNTRPWITLSCMPRRNEKRQWSKSLVFRSVLFRSVLPTLKPQHLFLLAAGLVCTLAGAQTQSTNYDEAKVGAYTLPDPLIFNNGKPVRSTRDWQR